MWRLQRSGFIENRRKRHGQIKKRNILKEVSKRENWLLAPEEESLHSLGAPGGASALHDDTFHDEVV